MLPGRRRPNSAKNRKRLKPRIVPKKAKKVAFAKENEEPASEQNGFQTEKEDVSQDENTPVPPENVQVEHAIENHQETRTEETLADPHVMPSMMPPAHAAIEVQPAEEDPQESMVHAPSTTDAIIPPARARSSKKKESPRAPTESERSQMLMKDFLKNSIHGVPMPSTARAKRIRKAQREKQKENPGAEDAESLPVEPAEEEVEEAEEPQQPRAPQVQLGPDGQIMINTESLVYRPEVEFADSNLLGQTVEDNSRITSATYSKRAPSERWSTIETKKFYRALRQCGTDFTMISTLFPNRNRRQIRNKFKREERAQPDLVMSCLNPKVALPIELENFEGALGKSLSPTPLLEDAVKSKASEL